MNIGSIIADNTWHYVHVKKESCLDRFSDILDYSATSGTASVAILATSAGPAIRSGFKVLTFVFREKTVM